MQQHEICLRLIRDAYDPYWTKKQKAYFDEVSKKLENNKDYFLSFTQRSRWCSQSVNTTHRYLIQSYGIFGSQDNIQNKLARMLDLALRTSSDALRGFYFPKHEDDSTSVDKKLKDALEHSFVFVQLVQNEMFRKGYDSEKNYCYEEYFLSVKLKKKPIYLFADGGHPDDLIPEDSAHYDLDNWYRYILGTDCVAFSPTVVADQTANIPLNRAKAKDGVAEKLRQFREALWDNVPGDLA